MQGHGDHVRVRCPSTDVISNLPPNIIEIILTLMPIRDAIRTSILSRKWRYRWVKIPKLVFDCKLFEKSTNSKTLSKKCKVLHPIYQVLLVHRGPLLELSIFLSDLESYFEIDQIMLHLSWNNTVEKFTLYKCKGNQYKLPSSFFSLQRLTHLDLNNCSFQPPPTFNGFSRLRSITLANVNITAKMLLLCISKCSLLKSLKLWLDIDDSFTVEEDFNLVDSFDCLPKIKHLSLSYHPCKLLATSGVQEKLPTPFTHLQTLELYQLCFTEIDEFSATLCLMRNAPNLVHIILEMFDVFDLPTVPRVSQALVDFLEEQDYADISLDHLEKLTIEKFNNLMPEMEFVKLILAKSPMLKKVQIKLDENVSIDEELKMLRDLIRRPLPRASPGAEVIILERPKPPVEPSST